MNWDGLVLQRALQIIRCDPSTATGFAPSELLLGRKLVYPIEFEKRDIDMIGTEFTTPLVLALQNLQKKHFETAIENIEKQQEKYKLKYDAKHNVTKFNFKAGQRVQYKRICFSRCSVKTIMYRMDTN